MMLRERWELKEEDAQRDESFLRGCRKRWELREDDEAERDGTLLRGCRKRWELREDDDAQRDGSLEDAQRGGSFRGCTERWELDREDARAMILGLVECGANVAQGLEVFATKCNKKEPCSQCLSVT
jgi:hypothetical protein